jgi:hypothetical protein
MGAKRGERRVRRATSNAHPERTTAPTAIVIAAQTRERLRLDSFRREDGSALV